MRTTFALDLDLRLISVNAPISQPHALRAGDVFYTVEPYDTGYGDVPTGTKFFVQAVAEEDCATWLRAEGDVPALFHWDNMLVIMPYHTEDVLPCLRAAIRCPVALLAPEDTEEVPPPSNVRRLTRAMVLLLLLSGAVPASVGHTRGQIKHQAPQTEPMRNAGIIALRATG